MWCLAEIDTDNEGWCRLYLDDLQLDPAAEKPAVFEWIQIRPATAIWRKILPHGSLRPVLSKLHPSVIRCDGWRITLCDSIGFPSGDPANLSNLYVRNKTIAWMVFAFLPLEAKVPEKAARAHGQSFR